MVGHPGTVSRAEALQHSLKDPITLIPRKIHIDIRGIGPFKGERTFEVKVVGDWVHIGDEEAV
ncbi:hypothetical protein SDC9_125984 [bioreactor metagenome]|uniref:Uncharacterized protein n=1 Tax=bioreactor metagenome TaxID=1076179 RepID=A0A645CPY5_9ZZZZ